MTEIEIREGSIFTDCEDCDALVNLVNCVGISGKGLALQFKLRFPDSFTRYQKWCQSGNMQPEHPFPTADRQNGRPITIWHFATKRHWRDQSNLADIEAGLHSLVTQCQTQGVQKIAIPPLGCGLGGLRWNDVHPMIDNIMSGGTPEAVIIMPRRSKPARMAA